MPRREIPEGHQAFASDEPPRTCAEVVERHATWTEVVATYPTCADLAGGDDEVVS